MPPVKGKKTIDFFKKDESVLPFFSWHPKTRVGTVLRIALIVFMLLVVILNLVANYASITLASATSFYPFTFIVPIAIIFALILLGLFKRMRSSFTRLLVGAIAAIVLLLGISLISTYISLLPLTMLSQSEYSWPEKYAAMKVEGESGKQNLIIMRQYARPEGSQEMTSEKGTDLACPYRVDALRITVSSAQGEEIGAEGAIYVLQDEIEHLHVEWTDENTARIYLDEQATTLIPEDMIARAQITGNNEKYRYAVDFAEKQAYSSATKDEGSYFRQEQNEKGEHRIYLYKTEVHAYQPVSVYHMTPESLGQAYSAYPSLFFNFLVKTNVKTEGVIEVKPYGELKSIAASYVDGVITLTPGEDSVDASGSITIHMNEKMDAAGTQDDTETEEEMPAPVSFEKAFSFDEITVSFGGAGTD